MRRPAALLAATVVVAAAPAVTPRSAPAQAIPDAFERLDVSLSAALEVAAGDLHELWDPGPGAELAVRMPFYLGWIEFGMNAAAYEGERKLQAAVPDFFAYYPFVGWGLGGGLPAGFAWSGGLRVGSFRMSFDTDQVPRGLGSESEFAYAAVANIRRRLGGAWFVTVGGHHRVVLTHRNLHQTGIVVGLGRSFRTPGWLRDFLD